MKRTLSAAALLAAMALVGCSQPAEEAPADAAAAAEVATDAAAAAPAAPAAAPSAAAPAAPGAPVFAVIYPGATPEGEVTLAQGPSGPGGSLTFTTDATPETVVAFYRERAEAAGLKPINALNQGESRAYSAGDGANGPGKLLSVVATPVENGPTSVQLMWSSGR